MKKIILGIFLMVLFIPNVLAKDDLVPVYIISKAGCSHCEKAIDYFEKLQDDEPDLLEIFEYEVFDDEWEYNSKDLQKFYEGVMTLIKEDMDEAATPVIVIGDYHKIGWSKSTDEIYKAIKSYKENNKEDNVKKIIDNLKLDLTKTDKEKEKAKKDTKKHVTKDAKAIEKKNTIVAVVGGIIILILAVIAFLFRK